VEPLAALGLAQGLGLLLAVRREALLRALALALQPAGRLAACRRLAHPVSEAGLPVATSG